MTDLISRIGLLEDLGASCYDLDALTGVTGDERTLQEAIMQYPALDAVPVVHARWIDTTPKWKLVGQTLPSARLQCSNCGRRTGYRQARTYKYCPKCGARMDGVDET